ncbi:hypothetical protein FH972_004660 [Carpinus fangiana]|uniref:UmuC domain-containing protein n=1 Tax=Carpinus fangiana TaxID=176857 RepID=A0A5N6QNQ4_9ROSI|nr:hypothetical protein FH972_004660 [Carpinus fangiana]
MEKSKSTSGNMPRPWQSNHTVYTNAKAGTFLELDKERVQRVVVYEMSKGSKYFENEERKEAFAGQKIESINVADRRVLELEAACDLSRIWLHLDMDVFYAAVETLRNPS